MTTGEVDVANAFAVGAGAGSDRAELASLGGARLTLPLALADVNEPVRVEAPASTGG